MLPSLLALSAGRVPCNCYVVDIVTKVDHKNENVEHAHSDLTTLSAI